MNKNWANAWLLLSIFNSMKDDNTFTFSDVIMHGDVINHAIFNYDEIADGINCFLEAEYLVIVDGKLRVSKKTMKVIEDINVKRHLSSFRMIEKIEKKLTLVVPKKISFDSGIYTEENHKNAIEIYRKMTKNKE